MQSWQLVYRDGFAPVLSTASLTALRDALRADDVRLVQGETTVPEPIMAFQDWPIEGGDWLTICAVAESGGWGVATVGMCEEFWARMCFEADQLLGEPAACRWLMNWFDDTPRDEMRRELLSEVERTLGEREADKPIVVNGKGSAA